VETRRDGLWIHYRMATLADPVLGAIADAVRHALTHLDAVRKDAATAWRRGPAAAWPAPGEMTAASCCEPAHGSRAQVM